MFKKITKIALVLAVILGAYSQYATVLAYVPITANAGVDQYLNHDLYNNNLTTTLQASADDPNGASLIYYWSCTGGFLSDANTKNPTFTFLLSTPQATSYTCTLKVTDTYGITATDNVEIYLNSNPNTGLTRVLTTTATKADVNGQAILNGSFSANDTYTNNYMVWFQWGSGNSYAAETMHQAMVYSGNFSQTVTSLTPNMLYHFRAVAQKQSGGQMYYGQDMTFYNNGSNIVLAGGVYGTPTNVSTGLTNNFLTDSFFLPLVLFAIGLWMYLSGFFNGIKGWIVKKNKSKT